MKKITLEVPVELSESIQTCQIELDGLKQLIGFLMSNTEYNVPEERIQKLQKDFMDKNRLYNELKSQVEDLIPSDFNKNKTSWNLDFSSNKVEIVEE